MSIKKRILVVDDNPESVWLLINFLESDYEVVYAVTPKKALTIAFSADRPDLILLDVIMPEMNGYEVFNKLKEDDYTKDIPIIFITALTELEHEVKGLEHGAQDYIIKPFRLPVVSARIKSVLNLKIELDRRLTLRRQLEDVNKELERQVEIKMREFNEAQDTLRKYEDKYDYLFKKEISSRELQTILVVDDNPENIHFFVEALEKEYTILYATSGRKALEIVDSEDQPDIILLDVMMPEVDGYEVCSRLKANVGTWDIPVIFTTSLDQEIDETKGLNLGAVDFISKPFSLPVLKARIKAALRLKEEMDTRVILTKKLEDLNKNLEVLVMEKSIALKQANDDLKASEKRYRTLYETAIEGIFESTPEGRLLSVSPSFARMLGYESSKELMFKVKITAQDLYQSLEDRIYFKSVIEENGEIFNFETQFRTKQGNLIWVMISAKVAHDEMSGKTYYQGFIIDITQQKETQLDNLQHLRALRLLNKIIAESVIETKSDGILKTACEELSKAFQLPCSLAGLIVNGRKQVRVVAEYRSLETKIAGDEDSFLDTELSSETDRFVKETINLTTSLVIQDAMNDERLKPVIALLEQYNIRSMLLSPLMKGGQSIGLVVLGSSEPYFFSEERVQLVQSVAGQVSTVMARIQNDENRRQLERQYFQAQKMEAIGTLTGGIAHDFNNILTVIFSVISVVKCKIEPDSELHPHIDQLQSAAMRAADLIRQLMAFSRQQVLSPKRLNLSHVVAQFEKLLTRVIGENIDLVVLLEPKLYTVKADSGQMEQVIMNLVVNASDAMPQGGCLSIETKNVTLDEECLSRHHNIKPGEYAMVVVSDTGTGIEKSIQNQIFDPFFSTKEEGEGTGLGLASVHGIVSQSGGHVWLYSEPGQGTTFKIYLPRNEKDAKNGQDTSDNIEKKIVGGEESILIVEDDENLRDIISSILTQLGYTVWTADQGANAAKIFSSQGKHIDLLFTDVIIPGKENGIQLAKRLCDIKPELKVLYMSGYADNAVVRHGVLELGMPFIQKPFGSDDLAIKIRHTLDVWTPEGT